MAACGGAGGCLRGDAGPQSVESRRGGRTDDANDCPSAIAVAAQRCLAGTAGVAGAAALTGTARAQQNANLGTPATVISNPPRDFAPRTSVDLSGSGRHRRRSVLPPAAANTRARFTGCGPARCGPRVRLVEPGPLRRLQRRLGQRAVPLHLGRRPGHGVPPAVLQQQRQFIRFSGAPDLVRAFQPPRRALGA